MTTFSIRHTTTYLYSSPVTASRNILKIFPKKSSHQKTIDHAVKISGSPDMIIDKDVFGNKFGLFKIDQPHSELIIDSNLIVETICKNLERDLLKYCSSWEEYDLLSLDNSFLLFLNTSKTTIDALSDIIHEFKPRRLDPLELIIRLNEFIFKNFSYQPFSTTIITPLEEVLLNKKGVCQDFSLILIALLRTLGIPARYVSGYICPNNNGMRGDGASHAWVESYLPGYGWLGLDPTTNCLVNDKQVKMAIGRDYHDVSPVKGEFKGQTNHTMEVHVSVGYEPESRTLAIA